MKTKVPPRRAEPFVRLSRQSSVELVDFALVIVGVEKLFSLLAAGLAEVILVESLNLGVEVRHAERSLLVVGVETRRTGSTDFVGREAGLTAAADTTAAASHDFDEVVTRLDAVLEVFADLIQDLLDIAHLVSDGDIDLGVADLDRSGLDAFHTADFLEVDRRRCSFLSDQAVSRTKSRFHNTARYAEDRAGTRVSAEKIVSRLLRKAQEVNTGGLDHASELAGRQDDIGILATAGLHVLVAGDLVLLSRTRHDGSYVDIVARDIVLLGPVGLRESGEHLLRRLSRREVLCEIGSVLLHPVGPRGAAARDERELTASREALDELGTLFHDRDVGGEVRIEHLVKAEHAKSRIDLTGRKLARLHAERFAESDADGGSDLDDASLGRVTESIPNLGRLVVLVNRADGAVSGALTALDAGRLGELNVGCGSHDGLFAAADELESPYVLHLLADFSAATALNALIGIKDDRRRGVINIAVIDFLRERDVADAEVGGDILKFAGTRTGALQAVGRMVSEDELENGLADLNDVRVVGQNLHTLGRFGAAGTEKLRRRYELTGFSAAREELTNDADTAARTGLEIGMVAERGDLDVGGLGGREDRGALGNRNGLAVDFKADHFCSFRHCYKTFPIT